jgi:hypothetical protein
MKGKKCEFEKDTLMCNKELHHTLPNDNNGALLIQSIHQRLRHAITQK